MKAILPLLVALGAEGGDLLHGKLQVLVQALGLRVGDGTLQLAAQARNKLLSHLLTPET